jgi:hypothetical protein
MTEDPNLSSGPETGSAQTKDADSVPAVLETVSRRRRDRSSKNHAESKPEKTPKIKIPKVEGEGELFQVWIKPALVGFTAALICSFLFLVLVISPMIDGKIIKANAGTVTEYKLAETVKNFAMSEDVKRIGRRVDHLSKQLEFQMKKMNEEKKNSRRRR